MKKYLLFVWVICLSFELIGQNGFAVVQGKITDKENKELLPFVSLQFSQNDTIKYKTETDFDGNYKVVKVKPGIYKIKASVTGYTTKNIQGFVAKVNMVNFMDLELDARQGEAEQVDLDSSIKAETIAQKHLQEPTGTVMGKVKSKADLKLLPGATLVFEQDQRVIHTVVTDSTGNFKVSEVKPGIYNVTVKHSGFQKTTVGGFMVKARIINFLDVHLESDRPLTKREKKALEKKKHQKRKTSR